MSMPWLLVRPASLLWIDAALRCGVVLQRLLEAVKCFDAIFVVEREINGLNAAFRHDARQQLVRPMIEGPPTPDG